MTDDQSAENALKSIRTVQATAGDRFSRDTWSYDLLYSLFAAALVGGLGLPGPFDLLVPVLAGGALGGLAWGWARKHGVWISGTTPRRARWVAAGLGVVVALLAMAAIFARIEGGGVVFSLAAAVAAFVAALVGSRLWRAVYRREMGLSA